MQLEFERHSILYHLINFAFIFPMIMGLFLRKSCADGVVF